MMQRLLIGALLAFVGLTSLSAQSAVIRIIEGSERGLGPLNPLTCVNDRCDRITEMLFPQLLNLDLDTGWLIPADENSGLVEAWEIDGNTITYRLRDDRFWSDGTSITAYDVFFSHRLAIVSNRYGYLVHKHTAAAAPLDDYTIRFIFNDATCDALPQANFPVIPVHVYDPRFAETIDYAEGDIIDWYENFALLDPYTTHGNPEYVNPIVTGGTYQPVNIRLEDSIHLISKDGRVEYTNLRVGVGNEVVSFLRGDTNLLVEPTYDRRAELHAGETSITYFYPGHLSFFIALNLADPSNPQPAFDEAGSMIEQTPHPILSNPAVRRAMQMALDVDTIIDTVLDGYGVPLASLLPPSALGFNGSLEPVGYDPIAARQILSDAGWDDVDSDGIRECVTCSTAEPGTQMVITLDYYETGFNPSLLSNAVIAGLVKEQLREVGVEVMTETVTAYNKLYEQTFEAFLVDGRATSQGTTWLTDLFRREFDRPLDFSEGIWNFTSITSYDNDEVDRLLREADYVPDCDVYTRRALYQQAEAILHTDQPSLWLFSPDRMIFSRQPVELSSEFWKSFLPIYERMSLYATETTNPQRALLRKLVGFSKIKSVALSSN